MPMVVSSWIIYSSNHEEEACWLQWLFARWPVLTGFGDRMRSDMKSTLSLPARGSVAA
jgi:hypothetical protein